MTNGAGFSGQGQTSLYLEGAASAPQSPVPVNVPVMLAQNLAGAAPAVVVVELEAGSIARLPVGTDISNARANGADLEFVQPDGTIVVIPGGAIANLVLFLGDIQIPADVVALMFETAGIQAAAGPESGADGAHGNFVDLTRQTVGGGLAGNSLLGDSSLSIREAESGSQLRDNTVPRFAPEPIQITLSEEGFVGGLRDSIGSPRDDSDVAQVRNIGFGLQDNEGHDLSYAMLAAPTVAWSSGGHPVTWTLDVSGTLLIGSTVDGPVVTIAFDNAADSYTVTLTRPLDHPDRDAEDRLELTLDIRVSDYLNASDGKLVLRIEDDSPEQSSATIAHGRADEHDLAASNPSSALLGAPEVWAGSLPGAVLVQGDLRSLVNAGGDGYGDNGFHLVDKNAAEVWLKDGAAYRFASQGDAVDHAEFLDVPGLGQVLGFFAVDGRLVFGLHVAEGGSYNFALFDQLDHPFSNDLSTPAAERALADTLTLDLSRLITFTDGDGDSLAISAGRVLIDIVDDVPVAIAGAPATGSGSENTLVGTDNVYGPNEPTQLVINTAAPATAPAPGADGWFGGSFGVAVVFETAPAVSVVWGGVSYAVTWNLTTPTTGPGGAYIVGTVTFQGQPLPVALLQVNIDGSVTYKQNFPLQHVGTDSLDLNFTYTLKDGDGSGSAPQTIKITIADGLPTAASGTLSANESAMVPVDHERGGSTADAVIDVTGTIDRPTSGADGWAGGNFASGIKFVGPFPELSVHVGGVSYALTFTQVNNAVFGRWNGANVIAFQINEDGSTRYVQTYPIYNSGASDAASTLVFKYTLTDGDGDTTAAQTVTVTMNDDAPTVVGNAVTLSEDVGPFAIDLDAMDSYGADGRGSIALAAQNPFVVTPGQGVPTFVPTGSLNTSTGVYTITNMPANWFGSIAINYVISDGDGDRRPGTSTLTVTAVNDAPVITSAAAVSVEENAAPTAIVYQATQTDMDSTAFTYSLTGADADRFTIDTTGAVRFKVSPDYELPADAGNNNVYDIIVNVSDGQATTTKAVAITVTDVMEAVAPTGTDGTVATNEDTGRAFQAADFGYHDINGDAFTSVIIDTVTLPAGSSLLFNGIAYEPGTVIGYGQIGWLVFRPAANANGDDYATLTFRVGDATGRYDATANTLTIDVAPVNDAPTLTLSVATSGPGSVSDDFSSNGYNGGSGNVSRWKSGWIETGDDGSATAESDIRISNVGGQVRFNDMNNNGPSSLTRIVDLTSVVGPRLSFDYQRVFLDDGEPKFLVDVSVDGVHWTRVATISGPDNDGGIYQSITGIDLSPFISAATQIRFTHTGGGTGSTIDTMYLDNVRIDYAGISESKYVENASPVAVIANAVIADIDDTQMERATLTLTNAQLGDRLWINGTQALDGASGTVSGVGFTVTVAGQVVTIAFAGAADKATYETILEAIRFDNATDNPATVGRLFQFTVHDGTDSSAVVPFTLQVVATNDAATIGGVATGTVNEDGTLVAGNTLTVGDPDIGQSLFQTPASLAGTYGTFSFNAATGVWGYTLNNAAANVQALTSAQTAHDKLTVTSLDGTASQVIDVTIKGRDEPVAYPDAIRELAPAGWTLNSANGHYYKYFSAGVSWTDAVNGAASNASGAYLATVTSAAEQAFVINLARGADYVWIGASDADEEGIWRWMTGPEAGQTLGDYQPWNIGEPNNSGGSEDYLEIFFPSPSTGTWNDGPEDSTFGYVAEWNPTLQTEDVVTRFISDFLTSDDTQAEWDAFPTISGVGATSTRGALMSLEYDSATQLWWVSYDPTSVQALQALRAGEVSTDTFTYSISDGHGGTASSTATITVVGVNDTATISGTATGTVTEDTKLTASGALTVHDVDTGEARLQIIGSLTGTYGTFTVDTATGVWGYTLNNSARNVQTLTATQTVHDTLRVMSADATAEQIIDVAITGADEAPGPLTVNDTDSAAGRYTFTASDTDSPRSLNFDATTLFSGGFGTVTYSYQLAYAWGAGADGWIIRTGNTYTGAQTGPIDYDTYVYKVTATDGQSSVSTYLGLTAIPVNGNEIQIASNDQAGNANRAEGDLIRITGNVTSTVNAGAGYDLMLGSSNNDTMNGGGGNQDNALYGLGGADNLSVSSNSSAVNYLDGGADDDTLMGGANKDFLVGGSGADTLNGGGGTDFLFGGADNDTLNGGAGNDTYVFNNGDGIDTITESGTGTSDKIILMTGGKSLSVLDAFDNNTATSTGDLVLRYGDTDQITVTGHFGGGNAALELINFDNGTFAGYQFGTVDYTISASDPNNSSGFRTVSVASGNNFIAGENGVNDKLTGGTGKDLLFGGGGDDQLTGGAGVDLLVGGDGSDTLNGGIGADTLVGGAGADTFIYASGDTTLTLGGSGDSGTISGYDVIADFDVAVDKLNLVGTPAAAVATAGTDGANSTLTIAGAAVSSHKIANGVISFDDAATFATSLALTSMAHVAAVVQYLRANDIGSASATVAFTATINSVPHTFIYQQVGDVPNATNDLLVDLSGVTITDLGALITAGRVDPIILDLDRNGFDFNGAAHFDLRADGSAPHLAWPGSGDGILVADLDRSGSIENGREVFSPDFGNGGHADSLAALRTYDSDGDGRITAADQDFATLQVWRDHNGDGISGAGELSSLAELGIVEIDLGANEVDFIEDGQHIFAQGTFTMVDGTTRDYVGVDFAAPNAVATQTGTDDLDANDLIADYDFSGGDTIDLSDLLGGAAADARDESDGLPDGAGIAHDFTGIATEPNAGNHLTLIIDDGFDILIAQT